MVRNRIQHWRLQLSLYLKREISQREMAVLIGVDYTQYNKWELSGNPPSGVSLWRIWTVLREYFPEINMQDLLEQDLLEDTE